MFCWSNSPFLSTHVEQLWFKAYASNAIFRSSCFYTIFSLLGAVPFRTLPQIHSEGVLFSFPCWSLPDKLPTTPKGIPMASGIPMATGQEKRFSSKVDILWLFPWLVAQGEGFQEVI